MADITQLTAVARDKGPRSSARELRRTGRVPGIVYGGGKDPQQMSLDIVALRREIDRGGFANRLIDLEFEDGAERVLPREVQLHPVTDRPIHVDFLRLSPSSEVRLSVPVAFLDEEESPGIKRGGLVNIVRHEVELICRADSIPENLVTTLAGLDIGDSVKISDIELPENVRPTITDRDFTIATISAPTVIEEEPTAEVVEGEEGVEGVEGESVDVVEGQDDASADSENKEKSGG